MTDRERFEKKAIENGAEVLDSEDTVLSILSANKKVLTTYIFDNKGKFEKFYQNCFDKIKNK